MIHLFEGKSELGETYGGLITFIEKVKVLVFNCLAFDCEPL